MFDLKSFIKSKTEQQELDERHVSHKERMYRKAAAERSAHKRKSGTGHDSNKHRENPGGLNRKLNRLARSEVLKQMSSKLTGRAFSDSAIRGMMIDRPGRSDSIKKRSAGRHDRNRAKRSDQARRSTRGNKYSVDTRGGWGSLRSDYENDMEFAAFLAEGHNRKFEDLFIRGLVPRNRIEQYKRIFDDVEKNIKLVRYQKDIADILDTLVDSITDDDMIYRRVRINLQKKRWNNKHD